MKRFASLVSLLVISVSILLLTGEASAQNEGAVYMLRPYCEQGYENDTWIYGPSVPSEWIPDEDTELCAPFEVQDPQTLKTPALHKGDTLDLDLVIHNPNEINISEVKAWLNYDPTVLTGGVLTVNETNFPTLTPGEIGFASGSGQVLINISTEIDPAPDSYWIHVARIQFTVQSEVPPGTPIDFHDVQADGHTYILAKDDGEDINILTQAPGSLFVQLEATPVDTGADGEDTDLRQGGDACIRNNQCSNGLCVNNACLNGPADDTGTEEPDAPPATDDTPPAETDGAECALDGECPSTICYEGKCQAEGFQIPDNSACRRDNQCLSLVCSQGVCVSLTNLQIGEGCASSSECESGHCQGGVCAEASEDTGTDETAPPELKRMTGAACIVNEQCQSNFCVEGTCRDTADKEAQRTAFSLLQVRNLRVTSEGSTAFLKWDDLRSSMLKAYNVYYSTTSGQYIQRKTVPGTSSSITIRNLPENAKYFFAIRAVNINDEESAFSQEVAVTIGNPASSTAPLLASQFTDAPGHPLAGGKVGEVPGETGASTALAALLLISAVAGTFFAFRRQVIAKTL